MWIVSCVERSFEKKSIQTWSFFGFREIAQTGHFTLHICRMVSGLYDT